MDNRPFISTLLLLACATNGLGAPLVPSGWDPKLAADAVMARLITVTAPQVKGAHDAEMVMAGDRAYIVAEVNELRPGEAAGWPEVYAAMSIVNLKTLAVEKVIPFARSEQAFENATLPPGACFVPRIIRKDDDTLRCYFASEQPGKRQAQTWFRDFNLASAAFQDGIHRAKLETPAGVFDMQPEPFHADAAAHGFKKPARDYGLYLFDSFKRFDGKTYVAINNYPGRQNALALVHDDFATFEIIGHFNEPQEAGLCESAVNRLPDGTWMAICRQDGGNGNYHFTMSPDGKTWSVGQELPFVPNGTSSKPTFDKFGGIYYLGWQEATEIGDVGRSVFNVDVSRDGKTWARKYRFETPKSFQYPTFREHGGAIWVCVTQGDTDPGRKERIMFGKLEPLAGPVVHAAEKPREGLPEKTGRSGGAGDTPLGGGGARIEFRGEGEVDAFRTGAVLFTDRKYTVAECPAWLEGKRFLRNSIESDYFTVAGAGALTLLTPDPGHPRAATQHRALESRGFAWTKSPETFQLFGAQPFDLARIYQKEVRAGERFRLGKWAVVLGFESAERRDPVVRPWNENTGERLYNGIVLPVEWPPQEIDPKDTAPMPVPYLDHPPAVIPIDVGRQLFVDDFLVQTNTLARVFHMPKKYEGNPVLKPETELEINAPNNAAAVPKSGGVWWDPKENIFKMWYEAGWIHTICYATSRDGLAWDRPELDVRPGSNQVLPVDLTPDSWTVVPDWGAKDPARRYTMRMQPPGHTQPGLCMTSADGIHWTNRVWTGSAGDRSTHFYNPFRKKWVHSIRSGFRGRSRHYWESDDFLGGAAWQEGEPVVWAAADRDDPPDPEIGDTAQLYNLDAVAYESLMLGMFEIHRGPANDKCMKKGLPKITELSFAYSRDGFHWHRPDRRAHIPAERRDVWDRGYVQSVGNICAVRGDRLWIYYTGFQGDTNRVGGNWMQNGMYDRGATGVAFLRRDGFASLDADERGGALTTRLVTFGGRHLFINAMVLKGRLRAEMRDADGRPIVPFTLENSIPFTGDSTIEEMRWKDGADLSGLAGKPARFHFEVTGGSLFAFWVSKDQGGRSDGYVAGGGPGYTGHVDTIGRAALDAERNLGVKMRGGQR